MNGTGGDPLVDPEFGLTGRTEPSPRRCWCGRTIPAGGRAYLVRPHPEELRILREKPFHSPACALDFAASMATVLEANLAQPIPDPMRRELLHERELWRRLIERLTPVASGVSE